MLDALKPKLLKHLGALRRIGRILWVRVAIISALSVLAALSAELLDPLIADASKNRFSQAATLPVLSILANGMLAVATFSLGVMVSSHRTLAEQSTPRIHRLLMQDTSTQSMLATFIGAFVFSLCAIILFHAGYYSDSASVIVFAVTVCVVIAIVFSLIRWIGQLTKIGSLEYALDRAETAARATLKDMQTHPFLGGVGWDGEPPAVSGLTAFRAQQSGFVTRINMEKLQSLADDCGGEIYIKVRPGDQILSDTTLGWATGDAPAEKLARLFTIEASRSVDQDPRYALVILREAASKALSPGINDQGTAIEIIARLERLLWNWGGDAEDADPLFPGLHVRRSAPGTLPVHAFRIIARDGGTQTEVLMGLVGTLSRLSTRSSVIDADTATTLLQDIHDHGMAALPTQREKDRLLAALQKSGHADALDTQATN